MNDAEFHEILKKKSYDFTYVDGVTTVTHDGYINLASLITLSGNVQFNNQGSVHLTGLTTLSGNVQFNNHGVVYLASLITLSGNVQFNNHEYVCLASLITLSGNVQFNNHSYVDLRSLTTLSENVQFINQGSVYLPSLTVLPDNFQFSNHGSIDLDSLTTLTGNVKFNNQGSVCLPGLKTERQIYNGKPCVIKHIDGYTMLMGRKKTVGEYTLASAKYFGGKDVSKLKKCFIASWQKFNAHGDTVETALRDLRFKIAQVNYDANELIKRVKERGKITFNDFRLITGACESGLQRELKSLGLDQDTDELPLHKALELVKGKFGANKMQAAFPNQ